MLRIPRALICLASVLGAPHVAAQDQRPEEDSVSVATWVITPRINSAGHFPFTGSLINKHINVDLNVFFEYRDYGFFLFKSHDLEDRQSIVNYFQPGIFRKFRLTEGVDLRLFFGYLFSQTKGFRDKDSDYYSAAVLYWTISEKLKVENTALFFDLVQNSKLANRLLLSWRIRAFTIEFFLWHRMVFATESHATSSAIAVNLPRIRIARGLYIQNTLSYQGYITENKPDFARREGFLYSLSFPLYVHE